MKKNFNFYYYLSGICLLSLLFSFTSCKSKMDEKEVYKYFKESPAVTLYATCCFTKEQPDLKDDFLGKCREYYYKAYNYKIVDIYDFQVTDQSVEGYLILEPTNETKACEKFDTEHKNTPHKAQVETKMKCSFEFNKIEGKWKLIKFQSEQYLRRYWDKNEGCENSKWKDLIDLDMLRHRDRKVYEY